MAYIDTPDDDEEEKKAAGQQGSEKVLSGATEDIDTGGGAGQAAGGAATAKPAAGSSGNGWTNLQNYVSANDGNEGVMGQKLEGMAKDQEKDVDSTQSGFYGQTGDAITSNTITDDGSVKKIAAQNAPTVGGQARSTEAPASAQAGEPEIGGERRSTRTVGAPTYDLSGVNADSVQRQLNATYAGPTSAADMDSFANANDIVGNFTKKAASAGDFEGRGELLRDAYGGNQYTSGEKNLDSFLLGSGAEGKASVQRLQDQGGRVASGWSALQSTLDDAASQGAATTAATQKTAQDAISGATNRFGTFFDDQMNQANAGLASNQASYGSDVASLSSSDATARAAAENRLGIDPAAAEFFLSHGGSAQDLYQQAGQRGLGDLVDSGTSQNYLNLLNVAGIDPSTGYSFQKTGNRGTNGANDAIVGGSQKAAALESSLKAKLAAQQAGRSSAGDSIISGLGSDNWASASKALGISPDDVDRLRAAGVDVGSMVHQGQAINLGDVANESDRAGWSSLMSQLGLDPDQLDLADRQDEGADYTFDQDAYQKALSALPAKDAMRIAPRPAVVAPVGALPNALNQGITGLNAGPNDIGTFATQSENFLGDPLGAYAKSTGYDDLLGDISKPSVSNTVKKFALPKRKIW